MPDKKMGGDVEDLYINDSNEYEVDSPSGLEEEDSIKTSFVNRPRSNRIILVVAIALLVLMTFVLFNLGTSPARGKKTKNQEQNVSRELSTEFISSTLSGMESENKANIADKTPLYKTQEGGLVLGADGKIVPESQGGPIEATAARVVYLQPTEDFRRAKNMFVEGLHSDTSVAHASVGNAMGGNSASAADNNQSSAAGVDASTAYNAGLQAGISQNMTEADINNNFISSQLKPVSIADEYVPNTRRHPISKYELNAGTVISAVMLTGINSDLPGTIMGQVSENIYDTATGGHLLIPQGSKILGTYNSHVVYGQQRILVIWTRIIYPDGSSLNIGGMSGSDQAGYAGMKQYVDNHYGRLVGAALFSSVFVALGKLATEGDKNDDGTESTATEAVMEQMTSFGVRLAERNLNISPTLRIKPGRRFTIITTKDVAFQETYRM